MTLGLLVSAQTVNKGPLHGIFSAMLLNFCSFFFFFSDFAV